MYNNVLIWKTEMKIHLTKIVPTLVDDIKTECQINSKDAKWIKLIQECPAAHPYKHGNDYTRLKKW